MADFTIKGDTKLDTKGAESGLSRLSSMGSSGLKALSGTAAVAGVAIGAAATAAGYLVKTAVAGYAQYEQLVGGVDTLFKTSSNTVQQYAANAYKTAGMDANQYMNTITSFSASLIQSLGGDTAKAAEVGNMAVEDMSDNANKMGTSIDSIQQTYQSLARGNFAMLDNLKLGYGGTKEELQRLLADAEKLTGKKFDISNFADITEAIHAVQTEMGITGTTAREASQTIEGSVSMMKASWSNLVTGMADDNADFDTLVDNFVTSASTVAENLLPRIEIALTGVGELIEKLMPVIMEKLPTIIMNVLPSLINAGMSIVSSLAEGLISNAPQLLEYAIELMGQLLVCIFSLLPILLDAGVQLISALGEGIISGAPSLYDYIMNLLSQIQQFIAEGGLESMLQSGVDMISNMANGILSNLPAAISAIGSILAGLLQALLAALPQILSAGVTLIGNLASGILNNLPAIVSAIANIIARLLATIAQNLPQLLQSGIALIGQLAAGLIRAIPQVLAAIPQIISGIRNAFSNVDWGSIGMNCIRGIASGLRSAGSQLWDAVSGILGNFKDKVLSFFGIHSPSRWFRDKVGKMLARGMQVGFVGEMPDVTRNIQDALDTDYNPRNPRPVMALARQLGKIGRAGGQTISQVININQPVSSPTETARAIKVSQRYGLAGAY